MKVLMGIDGSAGAFAAARMAGSLMDPAQDQAVLYYAPPEIHARHAEPGICERARTALADAIFAEARGVLPEPLRATSSTIVGTQQARQGVLAAADDVQADWIAVGARGLGRIEKLLLGSVSTAVVRNARVPVLVVRHDPTTEPLRPLLTFDGSPSSREACQFASRLQWPADLTSTAVTVCESMMAGAVPAWLEEKARSADAEAMAQAWVREHEAEKAEKQAELDSFTGGLTGPLRGAQTKVIEGEPAEQILHLVAEQHFNLIVLGAHGKTPFERFLLGSTSEHVLSHAACSVLVVRSHRLP